MAGALRNSAVAAIASFGPSSPGNIASTASKSAAARSYSPCSRAHCPPYHSSRQSRRDRRLQFVEPLPGVGRRAEFQRRADQSEWDLDGGAVALPRTAAGEYERLLELCRRRAAGRGEHRRAGVARVDDRHGQRGDHAARGPPASARRPEDRALRAEVVRPPRLRTAASSAAAISCSTPVSWSASSSIEANRRSGSGSVARTIARYSDSCSRRPAPSGAGQLFDEASVLLRHVHHEHGQRAPDRVHVTGDRGAGAGDLGCLVAGGAVDRARRRRPSRRPPRGR